MSDRSYVYDDFPEELYLTWINSGTIGGFYNANVKSRFEAKPLPMITFAMPARPPAPKPVKERAKRKVARRQRQ